MVDMNKLCDLYNEKSKNRYYDNALPNSFRYTTPKPVLRPEHYGGSDNPYEVFNVLEAWGLDKDFYLGNVIKYLARAGKKDAAKELEDLEKAEVYLKRRIAELKK